MNRLFRVLTLFCFALFVGVGVASADTLQFTLTNSSMVDLASFSLPSGPISVNPADVDPGFGFIITPANLTVNTIGAAPAGFVAFFNGAASAGGGLQIFTSGSDVFIYLPGPQIYGGTESAPTFPTVATTFSLAGGDTLTISDLTRVSTPEPAVTILLAIGLFALGLAVLRFKPSFGVSAN